MDNKKSNSYYIDKMITGLSIIYHTVIDDLPNLLEQLENLK